MAETKPTVGNTTANPTVPQGPRVPDEGKDTERTPAQTPAAPVRKPDNDADRDEEDGDETKRAKRVAAKEKVQPW